MCSLSDDRYSLRLKPKITRESGSGENVKYRTLAIPAIHISFDRFQFFLLMKIKSFVFNPFATNCFVAGSDGEAAVVDPSCMATEEIEEVVAYLDRENLTAKHLLLTHGHIDHIFGCAELSRRLGLGVSVHRDDFPLLENAEFQARMFGLSFDNPSVELIPLAEGDEISFGNATWDVVHTPGHSPGSVSFVDSEASFVIAGDVLFAGSIGRTDLWQGSMPTLMRSIFQKILPLGGDYVVYSGHGPQTTIGEEARTNRFLIGSG